MTVAAAVLVLSDPTAGGTRRPARARPGRSSANSQPGVFAAANALTMARRAGADEMIVVLDDEAAAVHAPDSATVLLDDALSPSQASAARVASDWAARSGHEALVLCFDPSAAASVGVEVWQDLVARSETISPIVVPVRRARSVGIVRLEALAWSLLPLGGRLEALFIARPELVAEVDLDNGRVAP